MKHLSSRKACRCQDEKFRQPLQFRWRSETKFKKTPFNISQQCLTPGETISAVQDLPSDDARSHPDRQQRCGSPGLGIHTKTEWSWQKIVTVLWKDLLDGIGRKRATVVKKEKYHHNTKGTMEKFKTKWLQRCKIPHDKESKCTFWLLFILLQLLPVRRWSQAQWLRMTRH